MCDHFGCSVKPCYSAEILLLIPLLSALDLDDLIDKCALTFDLD